MIVAKSLHLPFLIEGDSYEDRERIIVKAQLETREVRRQSRSDSDPFTLFAFPGNGRLQATKGALGLSLGKAGMQLSGLPPKPGSPCGTGLFPFTPNWPACQGFLPRYAASFRPQCIGFRSHSPPA